MGATWSKERILGRFRSFRGIHGRGDVSLPQFIDGVVCMGSYRRGDPLWDIAHRRLQNTNGLRPLRSSPFVICYGNGHRSWHQDAIRGTPTEKLWYTTSHYADGSTRSRAIRGHEFSGIVAGLAILADEKCR